MWIKYNQSSTIFKLHCSALLPKVVVKSAVKHYSDTSIILIRNWNRSTIRILNRFIDENLCVNINPGGDVWVLWPIKDCSSWIRNLESVIVGLKQHLMILITLCIVGTTLQTVVVFKSVANDLMIVICSLIFLLINQFEDAWILRVSMHIRLIRPGGIITLKIDISWGSLEKFLAHITIIAELILIDVKSTAVNGN